MWQKTVDFAFADNSTEQSVVLVGLLYIYIYTCY